VNVFTVESVRTLKGAPLSIVAALSLVTLGVSKEWLARNTGYTDKPIAQALAYLREHGYVVESAQGWKLAGPERQLPLGADQLADATDDAGDPVPLQAGVPLDQAPDVTSGRNNSDSALIVVLKESDSKKDSFNNNNNGGASRKNSDSAVNRKGASHIADVARALLSKGAPQVSESPLPADLQLAAERLVSQAHLPREKAELVAARSPWPAPKILEQLEIWLAYRESPAGANLTDGGFPYLVAARIEKGDECPVDTRAAVDTDHRYDGYIPTDEPSDEEQGA